LRHSLSANAFCWHFVPVTLRHADADVPAAAVLPPVHQKKDILLRVPEKKILPKLSELGFRHSLMAMDLLLIYFSPTTT